jgi:hypothetical protein
MKSNNQSLAPTRTEITSTAFRLPTELLRVIDRWCDENDLTRSQFIRRCITDRIDSLGIANPAKLNADQLQPSGVNSESELPEKEPRRWSPEVRQRFERGR